MSPTAKPKTRVAARFVFACNEKPQTLAQRVAVVLRDIADRLDGRESLAIRLQSTPPLTQRAKAECVHEGLLHLARCAEASLWEEVTERRMHAMHPYLFTPNPPTEGDRDGRPN